MRYSDELIDEIKRGNDIVDVVSQYVTLKRSGRNFFGLCPFHNEKSPSFAVSPDKQIFHCFGCGVGGNVIHFLSKIENIGFVETVQMLANRANITLPTLDDEKENKQAYLKSRVYEINDLAAQYYHKNLYQPGAKVAQEYVKKRKLDNNTLKTFMIGYSGNFNELYNFLKSKGFTEQEILASSLVNKNENGTYIDRFRKRLMIPIQDERGRIVAFGGRILIDNAIKDAKMPKYINSSENIVYSKGRHLFGLYAAKKDKPNTLLIVEGYMDTISLHQRGITNVVASLGTALTEQQGRLLRRNCDKVIIGYDSDTAGRNATMRGLEILKNMGCDIRILQLSGAKDPDEYILKYGPERLQKCMNDAISLVEYKVKILKSTLDLNQTNDKIKFLKEVAKEISKIDNSFEKEVYVDKISLDYKISKDSLYAEINKLIYGNNTTKEEKKTENKVNHSVAPVSNKLVQYKESVNKDANLKKENMIIYLLINYPQETYGRIKDKISWENIKDERNKVIIKRLYEELEKEKYCENVVDLFQDEDTINYITWIMASDFEINEVDKCVDDILNTYEKDKLISMRNEIVQALENTDDLTQDEIANLELNLSEIIIKLAKIK